MILQVKSGDTGINLAAEYLFNHGLGDHGTEEKPITFESLTAAQKLTLVTDYQKQVVVDLANTQKVNKAMESARATEEESKYAL